MNSTTNMEIQFSHVINLIWNKVWKWLIISENTPWHHKTIQQNYPVYTMFSLPVVFSSGHGASWYVSSFAFSSFPFSSCLCAQKEVWNPKTLCLAVYAASVADALGLVFWQPIHWFLHGDPTDLFVTIATKDFKLPPLGHFFYLLMTSVWCWMMMFIFQFPFLFSHVLTSSLPFSF